MRWAIILLILILPTSLAIGISPASSNINFEPFGREVITLEIHNDPDTAFEGIIYITGDLKEFMELSQENISFRKGETKKSVSLTLTMPRKVQRAGTHIAEIKVREVLKNDERESLDIKPTLGVVSRVNIHVPYPGKYATAKLKTVNVDSGASIPFYISIFNRGEENIDQAYAKIRIYDPSSKKMGEVLTDILPVSTQASAELKAKGSSESLLIGNYDVKATVYYDDKIIPLEGSFAINGFMLELIMIDFGDFKLGDIARLEFALENKGNRAVHDAYVRAQIRDSNGNLITTIDSIPVDVKKGDQAETQGYWDTKGVKQGKYKLDLFVHYDDKVDERNTVIYVGDYGISLSELTGLATAEGGDVEKSLTIVTILLVTIAVVLMIWKYWKNH